MATAAQKEIEITKRVVDLLAKAQAVLAKGWCQGTDALDADDNEVAYNSPKAVKRCVNGAILYVAASKRKTITSESIFEEMLGYVEEASGYTDITEWNDHDRRTKPQIIKGFAGAIKLAKKDLARELAAAAQRVKGVAAKRK